MSASNPRKLEVVVTFLEMLDPPDRPAAIIPPGKVAIVRAENPTLSFYRYLYNTVGEPWLWWLRRLMGDEELAEILAKPETHVYVLYVAGVPAGFAELDLTDLEENGVIDLHYMGLIPDFIGKGYGKYLLNWAIDTAWGLKPQRITVNTCSLDHPSALGAYQKAGFGVYDQRTDIVDDPRDTGLIPHIDHHVDHDAGPGNGKNADRSQENENSGTLIVDFPERAR
ncbi:MULTISPECIES: GNAT family N-acetyltransferase [Thalassospira]|uniref:GNAT family acetyltransferase n=1 Tax=Thalassospira xiamenensis TaxID=220697 RepID=A0A154KU21_9PROT|nr:MULTISPECIES: GNAT family N-acetyltransferase [Thalassospira]KZB54327.1 GNAT family acetyltransferase [Thalassospira xiamenensis]MAZ35432.1 N-acetyltransferase [Thalassospira sp.]MCH2274491.1 GNAT family N-acetyltransferase [Thalassospira sp.]RCK48577.1 GNAT family acetyltransferase [Thalassospira xiamenensis]SOB92705.1 Ribosomal protein S18 acetylase RimI [Thalassospira xiamenensis]